jgi:hypothetical protein
MRRRVNDGLARRSESKTVAGEGVNVPGTLAQRRREGDEVYLEHFLCSLAIAAGKAEGSRGS